MTPAENSRIKNSQDSSYRFSDKTMIGIATIAIERIRTFAAGAFARVALPLPAYPLLPYHGSCRRVVSGCI